MKDKKQDRAWELLDAIGEADERFVADANAHEKRKFAPVTFFKQHMSSPRAVGVIAACLVLAIALPVFLALLPGGGGNTVSGNDSEGSQSAVLENSKGESSPGTESSEPGTSETSDENTTPDTSGNTEPAPRPVVSSGSNLMAEVHASPVAAKQADDAFLQEQMRFSLALLQQAAKGERAKGNSLLLSPLSAQFALSMAANGASGQTREEMRALLAGNLSMEQLNGYLHTLMERMTETGDGCKVNIANAIWYNDWVQVYEDFLQTNADYYGAGAYRMPFDDDARDAINAWASEQTDGMIREAISKIDPQAAMYLLNATLFDAEWKSIYLENDIHYKPFTSQSGKTKEVPLMYERAFTTYYDDGKATGFAKPYKGDQYAFVALLPNEGVDVYDYVAGLTAKGLLHTLQTGKQVEVMTALPKFSCSYESKLEELLPALGMESAFVPGVADFSNMMTGFDGNGHLETVNQKTVISVGELGTKAASVTVAIAYPDSYPNYEVLLDRPFVYMIVDRATNLPLFMGVQTDVNDSDVPQGEAPEIEGWDDEPYDPEPPVYEGKDFTGLTVRLKDGFVTPSTSLLQFLLENGSETEYAYFNDEVLLQKKTEKGWETLPRIHNWHYLWRVSAGETVTESFSLQNVYGIKLAAGETYRVVFPGVEELVCEFTVTGTENGTPEASELRIWVEDGVYAGMIGVVFDLTNNSALNFVYRDTDILLEQKTENGWKTFSLLNASESDKQEMLLASGSQRSMMILPEQYGVELQSGATYRVAFANVPGLYGEFTVA